MGTSGSDGYAANDLVTGWGRAGSHRRDRARRRAGEDGTRPGVWRHDVDRPGRRLARRVVTGQLRNIRRVAQEPAVVGARDDVRRFRVPEVAWHSRLGLGYERVHGRRRDVIAVRAA